MAYEVADMSKQTTNVKTAADVDVYLAELSDEVRTALQELRQVIRSAAPEAVETFSYGLPSFKYRRRPLVAFGAGRNLNHCALYVMSGTLLDGYRDELKAYDTAKGTIRFSPASPIPDDLVTRIVRARVAETDATAKP